MSPGGLFGVEGDNHYNNAAGVFQIRVERPVHKGPSIVHKKLQFCTNYHLHELQNQFFKRKA